MTLKLKKIKKLKKKSVHRSEMEVWWGLKKRRWRRRVVSAERRNRGTNVERRGEVCSLLAEVRSETSLTSMWTANDEVWTENGPPARWTANGSNDVRRIDDGRAKISTAEERIDDERAKISTAESLRMSHSMMRKNLGPRKRLASSMNCEDLHKACEDWRGKWGNGCCLLTLGLSLSLSL